MKHDLGPTSETERIEVLDALRGFALFGIFLANIRDFSGLDWTESSVRIEFAETLWFRLTDFLNLMLISGKFYTIFSFLFGLGFALQLSRMKSRGANGVAIYRRRLLLLLAIGIVHISFVWWGDILVLYAVLGLFLPLVYNWSDQKLLSGATFLLLLPIPGYILMALGGLPTDLGFYQLSYSVGDVLYDVLVGGQPPTDLQWVQKEDWRAFFAWTMSGPPYRLGHILESWRIPKVFGIMMLGLWAGRHIISGRLIKERMLLKRVAIIGFAIGIPANMIYASLGGLGQTTFMTGLQATALYSFGVVPLGLAYAATLTLYWRSASGALCLLNAPGRMALSNYLMQSLIGIAIFYGIGWGLIGRSTPSIIYSVAIGIFVLQLFVSHVWLRYFRQGPMEWLWRISTYRGYINSSRA